MTISAEGLELRGPVRRASARERWSWALYDFSNTIWSMNVVSLYLATWLIVDLGASNAVYSWATSISSIIMAASVPILGAISDARRRRKPWVVWFTVLSCVATAAIGFIGTRGGVPMYGESVAGGSVRPDSYHISGAPLILIAIAFSIANYAYQAAQPFYNAMLPELVPPEELGVLSGLGTAVGYMGTIVGLLLVAPFFDGQLPFLGALPDSVLRVLHSLVPTTSTSGRVATFMPTALLFLLFSLPLFFFVRDRDPAPRGTPIRWREAFIEVGNTVRDARQHPGTLRFIVASFIYQDAVGTISAVLGLYAIKAVGFRQGEVNTLYILLTVPAVIGSYVCGRLVDRYGAKKALFGVILGWVILLAGIIVLPGRPAFWAIGAMIGFIFGGVPTAERPLLLSLVPEREAGRFFSLMLLSSRAASFLGPLVWAYAVDGLEPRFGSGFAYRVGVGTVLAFFAISLFVLYGVPNRREPILTAADLAAAGARPVQ
ncbi:MAG TPA: MFS transporter [Gemmatimonadaceae bacterium]|jgi:UMF1 family MFS transporter